MLEQPPWVDADTHIETQEEFDKDNCTVHKFKKKFLARAYVYAL